MSKARPKAAAPCDYAGLRTPGLGRCLQSWGHHETNHPHNLFGRGALRVAASASWALRRFLSAQCARDHRRHDPGQHSKDHSSRGPARRKCSTILGTRICNSRSVRICWAAHGPEESNEQGQKAKSRSCSFFSDLSRHPIRWDGDNANANGYAGGDGYPNFVSEVSSNGNFPI